MICASCLAKTLLGSFERSIVLNEPRNYLCLNDTISNLYSTTNTRKCSCCGRRFSKNEIGYNEQDIVSLVVSRVGTMLTDKIRCCTECGTGTTFVDYSYSLIKMCDDKDEREEAERELAFLNTSETVEELCWNYLDGDEWIEYLPLIASSVFCPNCRNGSGENYAEKVDHGKFNQYSEIYTKSDIERFNDRFYGEEDETPDQILENIIDSFEYGEIRQITEDYIQGKTNSKMIIRLEEYIKSLYGDNYGFILSSGRTIYRARSRKRFKCYFEKDLWETPANMFPPQGRYNEKGLRVFYCSSCIETLKKELKNRGCGHAIGKFLVNSQRFLFPVNRVFSGNYAEYVISENSEEINGRKKSYLLTNLISAMCMKAGYDGIVYTSVQDPKFVNYALFCNYIRGQELTYLGKILKKQ